MRNAIYAGTFDPITTGHLSVIERGVDLFDQLIIVVAVNPDKHPLFSVQERVDMINDIVFAHRSVQVISTTGYVVHEARKFHEVHYLLRGIRNCTDARAELHLALLNKELAPEIETVFVPAHPELSDVSSSKLKELALHGQDISKFCPSEIAFRLKKQLLASAQALMEDACSK